MIFPKITEICFNETGMSNTHLTVLFLGTGVRKVPPVAYGGLERAVYYIASEMSKDKCNVRILTIESDINERLLSGYICTFYNILFSLLCTFRIIKSRTFSKIDVVEVGTEFHVPFIIYLTCMRRLRLKTPKLTYRLHCGDFCGSFWVPRKLLVPRLLQLITLRRATAIIVLNSNVLRYMEHYATSLKINKNRLFLMFNGVDNSTFKSYRSALCEPVKEPFDKNLKADEDILLCVGNFCEQKNQLAILNAAPLIISKNPNIKFVFVGDIVPSYFALVNRRIKDLKLSDHVIFQRNIKHSDMPKIYNSCTIYLQPSMAEGYPLTLLEALSCGCPVLVSPLLSDFISDGENGLIVDPNDTSAFADSINALLMNRSMRCKLSSNATQLIEKKLSWAKIAEQSLQVYCLKK
jgi:glycosyltransferase involved in cell wall biosynthesis